MSWVLVLWGKWIVCLFVLTLSLVFIIRTRTQQGGAGKRKRAGEEGSAGGPDEEEEEEEEEEDEEESVVSRKRVKAEEGSLGTAS